ncbi:PREDICTED: guanylate-binding protein 6-like isoform X2 [Calidris pugnax]|uniref:guanylate-binding protein 6-like isoform X2 n=1 Tax=Calidris pugnax TaxID=198806 RepID=UPI00071DD580|nr:PREDICTED: guanylate-binding protein 6-like isoform X2 [Calidris pugnax]
MWCVPHPSKPGHALEGLGHVEKGDTENDTWIFVLTVLLSSTLIYNSRGTIDQQAMEQLHYVMKLTEQVKLKAAPGQSEEEQEDPEEVAPFFPAFVWTVQDFTMQLEMDGKGISEDQYLEKALTLKAGSSSEIQRYNQPRERIRKCFVFDQPAPKRDLARLEELWDDEIDPKFQQQVEKFCSHIWEKSPPKTIPGGRIITGSCFPLGSRGKWYSNNFKILKELGLSSSRQEKVARRLSNYALFSPVDIVHMFASKARTELQISPPWSSLAVLGKLAETYVETIQSGEEPCLERAVLALAAVKEAVKFYQDLMEKRVKLPTETVEELRDLPAGEHGRCSRNGRLKKTSALSRTCPCPGWKPVASYASPVLLTKSCPRLLGGPRHALCSWAPCSRGVRGCRMASPSVTSPPITPQTGDPGCHVNMIFAQHESGGCSSAWADAFPLHLS